MRFIVYIFVVLSFVLFGCRSSSELDRGHAGHHATPLQWGTLSTNVSEDFSTGWLATFADKDLNHIVNEAMEHNRDLKVASARLLVAHEQTASSRAARRPTVRGALDPSYRHNGNGPEEATTTDQNVGLGLNVSWEIDLWGRLRDLDLAAEAEFAAAEADFRSARLSLAANTAKAWFNFINAVQQTELAESTRASFQRNHRITERNYKAGDPAASPLNVQFGRTNVAAAERGLVRTRLNRDEAARTLEVLLGRYPSAELAQRAELPPLPHKIEAGLPSELLLRRPDLIAAVSELEARTHRATAARKSLLPALDLRGGVSSSDDSLSRLLLDPEYFVWNIAAGLSQTIYQGGAPTARARQAVAEHEVAIHSFADRLLTAFREVESALASGTSLAEQERFLEVELAQANLAETQAARDYAEGLVDIISLLEAQRRAVNARNDMISLRNQRLQNRVDLYLALGGDFEATTKSTTK